MMNAQQLTETWEAWSEKQREANQAAQLLVEGVLGFIKAHLDEFDKKEVHNYHGARDEITLMRCLFGPYYFWDGRIFVVRGSAVEALGPEELSEMCKDGHTSLSLMTEVASRRERKRFAVNS